MKPLIIDYKLPLTDQNVNEIDLEIVSVAPIRTVFRDKCFMETVFSKIIRREIPATIVYEDDLSLAFLDISPKAPVHVLIIPKKPIESLEHVQEEDLPLVAHLYAVVKKVAAISGVADSGYRIVINCGREGGQEVPHLHLHLMGGKQL